MLGSWLGRFELAAQIRDVGFDHIGVMFPVVVVEMLQQLSFRHDDAGPMDQVFEDVVLRRRKIHRNPGTMNALLDRIDFQI